MSAKIFNEYSNLDLEQRKVWYTPVVEAYDRGRPRYPEALIQRAMEAAHMTADSTILEVGGGSGIATIEFAILGCAIDVVEPNPAFSQMAERRLAAFPKVQLFQQSFEEWQVKLQAYSIVLSCYAAKFNKQHYLYF
ncbi:class I SAM-dependent methyltransferase [Crinalium epipsammum]|uniref:class I SAM-dependent methyltransferase n=1 Tax=Crinalium epipsammum TaxID=241425 RepID=UPI0002E24AC1|nr:class I SAM-dependent methyltransferase [Crinalium epipsammum]